MTMLASRPREGPPHASPEGDGGHLVDTRWYLYGIAPHAFRFWRALAASVGSEVLGGARSTAGRPPVPAMGRAGGARDRSLFRSADVVVTGDRLPDDDPELAWARRHDIPIVSQWDVLGELAFGQSLLAVVGSYGRPITAAALAFVFRKLSRAASFLLGADVPQLGGGSCLGDGEHMVVEVPVVSRSSTGLRPGLLVVTDLDRHAVGGQGQWEAEAACVGFVSDASASGRLIANVEALNARRVLSEAGVPAVTYGLARSRADYRVVSVRQRATLVAFDVQHHGKRVGRFRTRLYGTHSLLALTGAFVAAREMGLNCAEVCRALSEFAGIPQHLELVGTPWDVPVVLDAARSPDDVLATLVAARGRFPERRVFCVYQMPAPRLPRASLSALARALRGTFATYVCEEGRGEGRAGGGDVTGQKVVRHMGSVGLPVHYVPEPNEAGWIAANEVIVGDVLVLMGSASLARLADAIVTRIAARGAECVAVSREHQEAGLATGTGRRGHPHALEKFAPSREGAFAAEYLAQRMAKW